jgi:hypothetical protein
MYGGGLGVGLLTRIDSSLYPVIVLCFLEGNPIHGSIAMGIYGFIRSLPVLLLYRIDLEGGFLGNIPRIFDPWQSPVRFAGICILAFAGGLFFARL